VTYLSSPPLPPLSSPWSAFLPELACSASKFMAVCRMACAALSPRWWFGAVMRGGSCGTPQYACISLGALLMPPASHVNMRTILPVNLANCFIVITSDVLCKTYTTYIWHYCAQLCIIACCVHSQCQ
jgi:hypothetical protein